MGTFYGSLEIEGGKKVVARARHEPIGREIEVSKVHGILESDLKK